MLRSPKAHLTATAGVAAAGLITGLLLSTPTAAGAARLPSDPPSPTVRKASAQSHRITLITGDVVTVNDAGNGKSTVTVDPAAGSSGLIRTQTVGKNLFVLPEVALPYLAANRLDRDLFNVTELIADGYDDAHSSVLPLIVEYKDAATARKPVPAALPGVTRGRLLQSIDGAPVTTRKASARSFWKSITPAKVAPARPTFDAGITTIHLDGRVHVDLAESVAQIGAPQAWAAGLDGTGTTVAILDTGIDAEHPDLVGQVAESTSFVPGEDVTDRNGHGTHTASTIVGTGSASDGVEKGVAPGARLAVGKVLGDDGFGQESWIIAGMEWAANHAKVVSMSLGSSEPSDGTSPMDQAVNELTAQTGALFVIAAGNAGAPGAIGAPGAADDALTVGAVDSADQLAYFSSMGPRSGDSAVKPDLSAPGVDISAARSQYVDGTGWYQTMSGTSMATPHVAGAAAILSQAHPDWTAQELKDTLMSTSKGLDGYSPYQVGTGRLDVPAALRDLHATGSVSFGFLRWPNAGASPIQRTITYTNMGDSALALDVAADLRDQSGAAAPDGLLTLSATQVTVAAHSTQTVSVTADPALAAAGSVNAGYVVASVGGAAVARTSLGLEKEAERYDLTLRATGRDGQPAQTWVTVHEKSGAYLNPIFVDGQTTVRVPPGSYSAMAWMDVSDGPDSAGIALLGNPALTLDQNRSVDLDARKATVVSAKVPQRTEATFRMMEYYTSGAEPYGEALMVPALVDTMYAAPTARVSDGDFEFATRWRLRQPSMDVTIDGKPLDATQQIGSAWLHGRSTLGATYLGRGTEADYAGRSVKGKAVVITRSADVPMYDAARVALAHRAAFLLVVNDQPGELLDYLGGPNGEVVDLPVAAISGTEGAAVIARASRPGLKLQLSGSLNSPWVYDLVDAHQKAIPAHLTYAPKQSELAKVDQRFHGDRARSGSEFRWSFRPQTQYGLGFPMYADFPSVRTDWVSTQPGTEWVQNVGVLDWSWDLRADRTTYHRGRHYVESWMDPVVLPRLGPGFWAPERQGDYLVLNLPAFADAGPDHTGSMDTQLTGQTVRLYDGSTLVSEAVGWQSLFAEVTPDRHRFRVTSDAQRPADLWGTSTRVHSEYQIWTAHANTNEVPPPLPFVQMTFAVDTDLAGDARAGARDTIGLTGSQVAGAVGAGRIAGGRLAVSYDEGKTWRSVPLNGRPAHWTANLTYPKNASRYVSLRATVWDSKGNTATQEVIRAYGLR
ncbi:S8 family serine peptidase [Angustibacter sp. McL0619]|uniref:S8 family serine peptidase n=1 Tax=Angustibacter sp. McL0619 TaxID=3415676 RepID=UPI003CF62361